MEVLKKSYIKYLVTCLIGIGLGWALKPDQTKIETRTIEVIKEVRKDYEDVKENTRVIERPDGTKETITDRTARRVIETDISKEKDKSKSIVSSVKPQWSVGAYMALTEPNEYLLTVDRRILGNIYIGAYGRTQNLNIPEAGIGIRIEF